MIYVVYMHVMTIGDRQTHLAQKLLDSCMCHKARMAARAVTRSYDDALRPTGLRATQLSVLAAVGARGALSIKSLADFMGMDRTTLTRNLRPLEERGYVVLAPEGHHRSRMLTLTAVGKNALEKALPYWESAQGIVKRHLGGREWPVVQQALAMLAAESQLTTKR